LTRMQTRLFVSETDLDNLRRWKYSVADNSITTIIFTPFWNWLVSYVPRECAPNVLTLAGFLCIILSFAIGSTYRHSHPLLTAVSTAILGYSYWHLDSIDGKHARNTQQSSPLGELFDHACDNLSTALATVTLFWLLGVEDERLLWAITQASTLQFLSEHVEAFDAADRTIRFGLLTGPGETVVVMITSGLLHSFGFLNPVWNAGVALAVKLDAEVLVPYLGSGLPWPEGSSESYNVRSAYLTELAILSMYLVVALKVVLQAARLRQPQHEKTRGWLLMCYAIRAFPSACLLTGVYSFGGPQHGGAFCPTLKNANGEIGEGEGSDGQFGNNLFAGFLGFNANGASDSGLGGAGLGLPMDSSYAATSCGGAAGAATLGNHGVMGIARVLTDSMFMSILTSDMIVAKMAGREAHPLLALLCLASTLGLTASWVCILLYYATLLGDICGGLNLPLLNPVVTVYCDGVFDLCHLGHMKQFEQALQVTGGTRLLVGVMSDKACGDYKRKPVMTQEERYATVAACKHVSGVVEGCPLVCDEAFLTKHGIHYVAAGEEYVDDPNDKYYGVPRRLGILKKTKRTMGVSSSDLFERVLERGEELLDRANPSAKK